MSHQMGNVWGARHGCFLVRVCLISNSLQSLTTVDGQQPGLYTTRVQTGVEFSRQLDGQRSRSPHSAMTARASPPELRLFGDSIWEPTPTRDMIATGLRPR